MTRKRLLLAAAVAAAFALFTVPALAGGAPAAISAVTKTVTPTTGTGPEITVTTANRFTIENGNVWPIVSITGLADGIDWVFEYGSNRYGCNQSGDARWASLYIQNASVGGISLPITIRDAWSDPTVVYEVALETYFANDTPPFEEGSAFADSSVFNTSDFRPYVNVYLPPEIDASGFTITLEKGGVVYGGVGGSNSPNSSLRTVADPRYTELFGFESYSCRASVRALSCSLFMGIAPEAGTYDICVYSGDTLYKRIEKAVSYTGDAVALNLYPSEAFGNTAGSMKAYVEVAVSGGFPSEFTVQLWEGDTLRGESSAYRIQEMYNSGFNAVYSIPLNASLQKNAPYTLKLSRVGGKVCGTVESFMSLYDSEYIRIKSWIAPCSQYANVVLYTGADDEKQYKFELKQGGAVLSTLYAMPSGGMFDLEFKDENGVVLTLAGNTSYNVSCYSWAAYNNNWNWSSSYSFYVRAAASSGGSAPVPDWSASGSISDGGFYANLYASNAVKESHSDLSKYSFTLTSVGGGTTYTFTGNEAETRFVQQNGSARWRFYFRKSLPATLKDGYFEASVSYDGVPITGSGSKNILGKSYPSQLSHAPDVGYYTEPVGVNYHVVGAFAHRLGSTPSSVTMELYKPGSISFTPDLTIHLTRDSDTDFWDVTPENSVGLDLFRQYNGVILVDGTPYSAFSERVIPAALLENNTQTYTASVTQSAHGTLSLSAASAGFLAPVYVFAVPEEGYELKPGSVKVNGIAIEGRGFLISENSVVTAEFQTERKETFAINIDEYIWGGEVSSPKARAAAGEQVTLAVDDHADGYYRYVLTELYYHVGNDYGVEYPIDMDTLTFTMPKDSVYIHASFEYEYKNDVSVYSSADYFQLAANGHTFGTSAFPGDTVTLSCENMNSYNPGRIKYGTLYYTLEDDESEPKEKHYITGMSFVMPDDAVYIYFEAEAIPGLEAAPAACSYEEEAHAAKVEVNCSALEADDETVSVVVGIYDSDDRLIGIRTVELARGEYDGVELTVAVNGVPHKARVFLLGGGTCAPLLDAAAAEKEFTA